MDPLRKAAVLLASLDAETADTLIEQMPPDLARRARELLLALDDVDSVEQQTVIEEFVRIRSPQSAAEWHGVEVETALAGQLAGDPATYPSGQPEVARPLDHSSRLVSPDSEDAAARQGDAFSFLQEADARDIAAALQNEHPQTAAIVLSHIRPELAGEVLAGLPPSMQAEVVGRLVDLQPADAATLHELEHAVQLHLARHARVNCQPSRGTDSLSAILQAAAPATRREILDNVVEHAPELAEKLEPPMAAHQMSFEDVLRLGDFALAQVLAEVEADVLTLALAGAPASFVQRVLDQIPRREARLLRQALDNFFPTRLCDVEQAQRELAAAAQRLDIGDERSSGRRLSLTV